MPEPSVSARPNRWWPLALVAIAIVFNLWTLRAETTPVRNLNDSAVHASMIRWAEHRIDDGHVPLDGWYPNLSLGFPQFHHYQSLPHTIAGAMSTVIGSEDALVWPLYLLLSFWPLCMYWSSRLFGFDRWTSGAVALVSPLVVSVTFYGYEHGSYTWRGLGVWSQLWGMWLLPLAWGLGWRAVARNRSLALAALAVGLTMAMHFLAGYLGLLSVGVWVLAAPKELRHRLWRATLVGVGGVLTASWVVVPLLSDARAANQSEFLRDTFWTDSYGAHKVLGWLVRGELFDDGRFPVLTILVAVGIGVSIVRSPDPDDRSRAVLGVFLLSLVLFIGRPTFGRAFDVLPGGDDLLLHRFLVGVHLSGLLLAGIGAAWLGRGLLAFGRRRGVALAAAPFAPVAVAALGVLLLAPAWDNRADYDDHGALLISIQDDLDGTDGEDVAALVEEAKQLGPGRFYAGLANNWGAEYKVGYVPVYAELLDLDADAIGFNLRTLSLSSDIETRFDERNPAHYELFNIRYLLLPEGQQPANPNARLVDQRGRHTLWEVPTTGYLQVGDSVGTIPADRVNIGRRMIPYMTSQLPGRGLFEVVDFGDGAPDPTFPAGNVTGPAGEVDAESVTLEDGRFAGRVTAERRAEVVLKATWHPRWTATVDGEEVPVHMVTPSFAAVSVPPGEHRVVFQYEPYPHYALLLSVGVLTLVGLAVLDRREARRRKEAEPSEPTEAA